MFGGGSRSIRVLKRLFGNSAGGGGSGGSWPERRGKGFKEIERERGFPRSGGEEVGWQWHFREFRG